VSGKPVVDLAIDDTTAARYGKHVAHAGWFKDASAAGQATKGTVIHWAHNWIVGAVTLRLPHWPLMRWVLPVVFCLYRKPPDCDRFHPFATRQVLAARMVCQVAEALPDIEIRVAAMASTPRPPCGLAGRPSGRRGRKPKKGRRLPTPRPPCGLAGRPPQERVEAHHPPEAGPPAL
jgi:hypothetical protein